jgi:S-adenosylmethionine:tRNA ribosyltransferase-isomerase
MSAPPRHGEVDLSRTEAYHYDLPPGRIARYPTEHRDESRLLVVDRDGPFRHLLFADLPGLLAPGDLLVLNESRVLPVRLLGRKPTGALCEVLLLRPVEGAAGSGEGGEESPGGPPREGRDEGDPRRWEALVRPGSKLKPGRRVVVAPGELEVVVEEGRPDGGRVVRLESSLPVDAALECFGHIPLPPYLEREEEPVDRVRYQTVFARTPGSVAAPTAGLHFTEALLARIEAMGVETARILLHVGPGTFRPVESDRVEDHVMHRELWEVPPAAAEAVARARDRGGRVWAVGTTVVRTLESAAAEGRVVSGRGETRLFIRPGYRFRVVEGLITNFHLPRSTLLMLVAALAGHGRTLDAYDEAIREGYRFYSYGDAMVVPPGSPGSAGGDEPAGGGAPAGDQASGTGDAPTPEAP